MIASLALAAGIHLVVGAEHGLGDSHGIFFLAAGVAQAGAAVAVAVRSTRRRVSGAATVAGALTATWLVVKAPGVLTGTDVDPLAAIATVAEVVTVFASVHLLRQPTRRLVAARGSAGSRGIAAVGLAVVATLGIAGSGQSDHTHHHDETVETGTVGATAHDEPTRHDGKNPDHGKSPDHDGHISPDAYDDSDEDHSHAEDAPHGH